MAEHIPSADNAFDAWQRKLMTYVTTQLDAGVADPETIRKLLKQQRLWVGDYEASTTAMAVALGTRQAKDNTRSAYEDLIRALLKRLEAVEGLDLPDLRVPDTAAGSSPRC